MEMNRLISLVLGFVVLILIFVWVSNRFRASNKNTQTTKITAASTLTPTSKPTVTQNTKNKKWNPLSFLFDNKKNTTPVPTGQDNIKKEINLIPSPTIQTQVKIIEGGLTSNNPNPIEPTNTSQYNFQTIAQIPETGASSVFFPLMSVLISIGIIIKKSA